MANLNSKYVIAPSLQEYFVDKDTGLPLSGGYVYFYENGTNIPKPVYEINGIEPDITYVSLGSIVQLSAVGTFQDGSGNDILPYYYPYDANGAIQLYSITVTDINGVTQFTRDNWPNTTTTDISASQDITNFVPNGQFLLHDNIPASSANGFVVGKVSATDTNIAQGGWHFVRSSNTATDIISYTAIGSNGDQSPPSGSPPYAVRITRTAAANDARTDLCIRYPDVNSLGNNLNYNLYFNGVVKSGASTAQIQVYIFKYYGSGGSSDNIQSQGDPITLTTSYNSTGFNIPLLFGNNSGKTIGDGNYVEVVVRLPLNQTFDLEFTDFCITAGESTLTFFPPQAPFQQMGPSTAGSLPTPTYDGSDLYLPIKMGSNGFIIDTSEIGNVIAKGSTANFTNSISTVSNELLADGSQYLAKDYSPLGIPYSRLANFYIQAGGGTIPLYGTGLNFATTSVRVTNEMMLLNNQYGSGVRAADGTTATGFTFRSLCPGLAATADVIVNRYAQYICYCQGTNLTMTDGAVVTGIVFTKVRSGQSGKNDVYTMDATACNVVAMAGSYFTYTSNANNYYVWFTYNGAGADPTPGGTGIRVDLYTGYTGSEISAILPLAMAGGCGESIVTVAASAITQSSWFGFTTANSNKYYVWYDKGTNADPAPAGYTLGIKVSITNGDTDAQVASNTMVALNSTYFRVPNLQGLYLRGYDPNKLWDLDATTRYGLNTFTLGDSVGTFEYDQLLTHTHNYQLWTNNAGTTFQGGATYTTTTPSTATSAFGGSETRSVNANVVWAIKY